MKYSQAEQGRIFVLCLEDKEIVHEEIERFAREKGITAAALIVVGGAGKNSKLVVGPKQGAARPVKPMEHILDDVHEVAGTGTLFPDDEGNPVLHMHMACGRDLTGIWMILRRCEMEITIISGPKKLPFTVKNGSICLSV